VRVATGTPTSVKNSSWPAGEQIHIIRAAVADEFRNWCGAFAGIFTVSPAHNHACAAERHLDLTFKNTKRLFEMWRRRFRLRTRRHQTFDTRCYRCHTTARSVHSLCENCDVERYATVIHEDPEGGFWAEVPALPGCYSQGETIDELMENVREAITGVLEVMKEQGKRPESNIQILDIAV
jgi:predicted RNase H-like HicB family nuclease